MFTSRGRRAAEISNGIVQLLSRATGRGPTKAKAVIDGELILVRTQEALTTPELTLIEAGNAQTVRDVRRVLHVGIIEEARKLVEAVMGEEVSAATVDVDRGCNFIAFVFVLDSQLEAA